MTLLIASRCERAGPRSAVEVLDSIFPSANSRRAVVSYLRKYMHLVLVKRLGGLSLLRYSVVRLTGRSDMVIPI